MDLDLIAREQVFPYHRALAAGIGRDELRRLIRSGACRRLHHGWFTTSTTEDPAQLHRLRCAALVQQYRGHAVVSHVSAVIRLGLPTYAAKYDTVHLMATSGTRRGHRKRDLIIHPSLRSVDGPGGLPHTSAGTVHPAVAIALAGLDDPRAFLVPADPALAKGLVSVQDLTAAVALLCRRPGVERVRSALDHCDARHESPGETLTAHVLRHLGYRAVPQVQIPGTERWTPGRQGYRVDFLIEGTRVIVEFDGRTKYESGSRLWEEKQREDRIRELGYEVVRLTMADLRNPARVREVVEAALRRSRRRAG